MTKVLFILKRRDDFNPVTHSPLGLSTGLFNSASFMQDMLLSAGIDAELEVAIDNNCVDRLVTKHRPTHVIIEALWVVPTKFDALTRLHPSVTWIVRLHSEVPFIANEGMALDWIGDYLTFPQVRIAANAPRMMADISSFLRLARNLSADEIRQKVLYLPNHYPQDYKSKEFEYNKSSIDIGCFGAIRPLKNQVLQAIAAIEFADRIGKDLHFHINAGRIETKGDPVLNNLRGLFHHLSNSGHKLINHEWAARDQFLQVCASMDIGMQVSFSETFNIVAADLISQGIPVVASTEVPWVELMFTAKPTESSDMVMALSRAYSNPELNVSMNQLALTRYTNQTKTAWSGYFGDNK